MVCWQADVVMTRNHCKRVGPTQPTMKIEDTWNLPSTWRGLFLGVFFFFFLFFIYLSTYILLVNRIFDLCFNILRIKIPLHKFLNSLKYLYVLVKQFQIKKYILVKGVIYCS